MKKEYDFTKGTRTPDRAKRLKAQKLIKVSTIEEKTPREVLKKQNPLKEAGVSGLKNQD